MRCSYLRMLKDQGPLSSLVVLAINGRLVDGAPLDGYLAISSVAAYNWDHC